MKNGPKAWAINQPATAKISHAYTKVKVKPFGLLPKKLHKKSNFFGANLNIRSAMLMLAAKQIELRNMIKNHGNEIVLRRIISLTSFQNSPGSPNHFKIPKKEHLFASAKPLHWQ
jgi:hypothetical protein